MTDEEQTGEERMVSIYVLPSETGLPPRAILADAEDLEKAPETGYVLGTQATWSRDTGCWMIGGTPVDPELGEAITEHAKALGVEW